MHREYHPADMDRLRARAFGGGPAEHDQGHRHSHQDDGRHDHDDRRGLYGLTASLGLLIGWDVLFGALGWGAWRSPFGVSAVWVAAVLGGARIVYGALEALARGKIGADVALAQACLAALVIGQPFVAAEVVFIAMVGEVLEAVTFDRARRAIHRLLDQSPKTARVRRDGGEIEIPAGEVVLGDTVVVRAGERVPVDGPVLVGRSSVDQSALTGEPIPVDKGPGDPVYTGTLNQFGAIEVRADKVGHETTFGQVLRLVAEARHKKAPIERVADRLARYFLPVVEVTAGLTLLVGYLMGWPDVWLRTVAVLVVACPCALVLATPAAVLASMAWLARNGVLVKGGAALERLAACDTFAFDKTGTLTQGRPEVSSLRSFAGAGEAEVLRLAATAEATSPHPLAAAVVREAKRRGVTPFATVESVTLPGSGVSARFVDDAGRERTVLVGNGRLMGEQGIEVVAEAAAAVEAIDAAGETPLLVASDGAVVGVLGARDAVRPEANETVLDLKRLKITRVAILTGDREAAARLVAAKTDVDTVEAGLLPADKARWVAEAKAGGRRVAFVGDGINDAPALATADVGIALGGIGADLAAEAGDLVLLGDPLRVLPGLVGLSRATVRVIRQNILLFAFGLNAVAMASAALGILGPVAAALLHQAGSLLVLLNAMRLLAYGDWASLPPFRQIRAAFEAVARLDDRLDPGRAFDGLLGRWRAGLALALACGVVAHLTWGLVAIRTDEVGLVRRFGRHAATIGPGLHLRWPPPVESVTRLNADRVRSLEVGFRTDRDVATGGVRWESSHGRTATAKAEEESLLLTGDGQLVELAAVAQYHVDATRPGALRAYAFGAADPDESLRPLAESAVRTVVGRSKLEALLTNGRRGAEGDVARLLQARCDAYGLGLKVTGVAFQDVHPPLPVVDAFRDVSRAESDRQRKRNEGAAYRAEAVASSRGRAAAAVNVAEAERAKQVGRTSGEAAAFRELAAARAAYPALTDHRLYWEAVAAALADKTKVILDESRARPRHLILNDLPDAPPLPALVGPRPPGPESEPR